MKYGLDILFDEVIENYRNLKDEWVKSIDYLKKNCVFVSENLSEMKKLENRGWR